MKKNIISITVCLCILIGCSWNFASAASLLTDASYNIDYNAGKTSVSFNGAVAGARATVVVMNPGFDLNNALNEGAIQYQGEVVADAEGGVNLSFTLNIESVPENNEYYPVYVKIPGREVENIISVCYAGKTSRMNAINALKSNKTEILALFDNADMRMCLGIESFEPYNSVDKDLLANRLVGKFDSFTSEVNSFADVCNYLKQFCVLELYNQNMTDKVYSESGEYLWESTLGFETFDKQNGSTLNNCYNTLLSESAKEIVRSSLFGKNLESPELLVKSFRESTVLHGLASPKVTGYAHVAQLLTSENRSVLEITFSRELNADEEALLAAHSGTFTDIAALEAYVEELFDKSDSNTNTGGGSGGGGFSGSTNKGIGSFSASEYVPPAGETVETTVFDDISDDSWALKPIAYLKAKGVVNGVNGNLFLPDSPVTREQFIKMLFAILDIEPDAEGEAEFEDVDKHGWYVPYISAAAKQGIVKGISDTQFGIGRYASRQDICTMLYRAMDIKASSYKTFSDEAEISDYAFDAIGVLSTKGIVNGYPDGTFRPLQSCTRAEAASLIYNAAMLMEVK